MEFDLRLLRHARALAEEGSFARAARTLHLTQPALTRSIQELERRTGFRLFDRGKGRVEPTDLGRVFLAHARDLLGRAEALGREVASLRGTGIGSLVVGSGTFPTSLFVGRALAAFLGRNPAVAIRLVNDNWSALISSLRRRELDFVVAAPPAPEESAGLAVSPLTRRQGFFLVRPGHPLLSRRGLALADVVAHPIVCTARLTAGIASRLLAARPSGTPSRTMPDVGCESTEMMRMIARTTDHVLLAPVPVDVGAGADFGLVALPLVDPVLSVAFAIIRLDGRTLPPIAEELVRDVVAADAATFAAERAAIRAISGPAPGPRDARPRRSAANAAAR